ncbi:MAG: hypothetical protein GY866_40680 [Proteobacteria bacterium]|nr:hypothetical protein [Pseudomonadota bacterium]
MKRIVVLSVLFMLVISKGFAVDGFRDFEFGDTSDTVFEKGSKLCRFGKLKSDTRWPWKSYLSCSDFVFKKKVKATLYFQFSDDDLARIYVVSKDIDNYFLIRHSRKDRLLPLSRPKSRRSVENLADDLIVQDQVHVLENEYRYTTFFHEGTWEWEFVYADTDAIRKDRIKEQEQLEEEVDKGVKGWRKFVFDDSDETIKEKLEGICSQTKLFSGIQARKNIYCSSFPFMEKKIDVLFGFVEDKLVKIELKLQLDWYKRLLPLLKKKYGQPYTELPDNKFYFPYIEFPEDNILMSHKVEELSPDKVWVSLKYLNAGFIDDLELGVEKKTKKKLRKKKSTSEKLMDNI